MSTSMQLKGIYAERPALFQIFLLFLLILAGSIISSIIIMGFFYFMNGLSADITGDPNWMRLFQLFNSVGTFLFPSLGIAWMCSHHPRNYLSVGKLPGGSVLWLTFLTMILFAPFINFTAVLNKEMALPEFMAPVENWMKAQEETAERLTLLLLSGNGFFTLLANLIVIAVTAAVTEEFLFRGTLERIIGKWTSNHHIVIWVAAIIFSAIHMQFYGFIPRMLLGAYFGYLLYWSKNIWLPIFAHFCNNAFAVLSMSDENLKNNEFITGDISTEYLLPLGIISLVTLFVFYLCVQKLRRKITDSSGKNG